MPETIIFDWIISLSNRSVVAIANVMIHSTIIISVGLLTAYLLRSKGAIVQSLVYRAVLSAIIICIPAAMLIEHIGFDKLKVIIPMGAVDEVVSVASSDQAPTPVVPAPAAMGQDVMVPGPSSFPDAGAGRIHITDFNPFGSSPLAQHVRSFLYVAITLIWFALTACAFFRLCGYVVHVRWLRKTATDADRGLIDSVWRISTELNVEPPDVMLSPFAKSPFLAGLFSPTILLPEGIVVSDAILYHELAHHHRHDCYWNMLSETVCALMPLQPLMTILSRAIEETSDFVSDNYALAYGDEAYSYAVQLASIAARFQPVMAESAVGVGFISSKSSLLKRIEHILDESGRFLISVRANVIAIVMLCAFGSAVVTGFFGFSAKSLDETKFHVHFVDILDNTVDETLAVSPASSEAEIQVPDLNVTETANTRFSSDNIGQSPVDISEQGSASAGTEPTDSLDGRNSVESGSAMDSNSNSDWVAFGEGYEQDYFETSQGFNDNDSDMAGSSKAADKRGRAVRKEKRLPVPEIIIAKEEPQESEYDRIKREPEVPRSAKAGNPLAELKLKKPIEIKQNDSDKRFSWEIMLFDKGRR